jgi:hypothetical protein
MVPEFCQPVRMFNGSFRNHVEDIDLAVAAIRKGKRKGNCANGRRREIGRTKDSLYRQRYR